MSNKYLENYFPFLGQYLVLSIICENLVTQLIKGHKKSIEQLSEDGFTYKINVFTEYYNKKYKQNFSKKYPEIDLIKEITVLKDLRNVFTHGAPLIEDDRLLLAKISDEVLESVENAETIIGEFAIDDLPLMSKGANDINKFLIYILEQEGRIPLQNNL